MVDATPSATPMPVPPVATAASTEAPSPPADPRPVFVPPSVTDPLSNLDFLPVDDAFALEMRAQSIEQLARGDALRRGESERIEAGRSQTNADLVAGRDRARVQGSLLEHTGHALAEQAAHLHTTVEGALDVHAAGEDTVLLAGHMSELWDGGAAIVAAMTDDTVAGGGVRVTTPLDLWVHAVMGVEERIGTCTADAVLMELGATHYEREYGPGVHAAGLAVYAGSLYQSSRSTVRALMRVSSGVRNLTAGGGGGGGGGDAGAGSAPGASPPPVPADTGAASESVTGTLAAGRNAAPATAPDAADALTGARRVPLEELVDSVGARADAAMGEAGTVMRAENLPELTRCAGTAEQLGALQETLRIDGAASGSEVAGGFRGSEVQGAVSMHPATGGGGPLEINPPSAVYGENAPMVRPHPGDPWGQGPQMKLGLLAGADRPPRPAAPKSDFHEGYSRLRVLRDRYRYHSSTTITNDFERAVNRVTKRVRKLYKRFGGNPNELAAHPYGMTNADQEYVILQETARQADRDGDRVRAGAIREALDAIHKHVLEALQALCTEHDIAEAPSTRAIQPTPVTAGWPVRVAAIPPPAHTRVQFDWFAAYTQLRDLVRRSSNTGRGVARSDFRQAASRVRRSLMYKFTQLGGKSEHLLSRPSDVTKAEQAYRALQDMFRRASESSNASRAYEIRQALETINQSTTLELDELTTKYRALDALSTQATHTMQTMLAPLGVQLPPARVGPTTFATPPVTFAPMTAPPPGRLNLPVPAHPIVLAVNPAFSEPAGGLVQPTGVPGPPPASGLPGPSLAEAAGARAGDLGRWWLDPPATASGTTAAEPAATETIVTPSLGETSSFWLQPVDPGPAPGSVSFDSGLHHAGVAVQPPPVTTAGRTGADTGAPPPAAGPWGSRPPGMGGEPRPVAFDPWSAPPGPSSRVVYTGAIRTPVLSTGAPPVWQGAETPGFGRAASGAFELAFARREAIARRFGTDDALLEAEVTLRTGGVDALGWSATRRWGVLDDLYRLHDAARMDSAAAVAMADVDWSALEALVRILDAPPPSP